MAPTWDVPVLLSSLQMFASKECDENYKSYDGTFLDKFRSKLMFFSILVYFLRNIMCNRPPDFTEAPDRF